MTINVKRRYHRVSAWATVLTTPRVECLSDYMTLVKNVADNELVSLWYRGHADKNWRLTAKALRYPSVAKRTKALSMLKRFKRLAKQRLPDAPDPRDDLAWMAVAQHHGLPTRLLDWSESAAIGLHFALSHPKSDGAVFVLNPVSLNRTGNSGALDVIDVNEGKRLLRGYAGLGGATRSNGKPTVAIAPPYDTARVQAQHGAFTIQGSRYTSIDQRQAPGLVCIPIPKEYKPTIRRELDTFGTHEMTAFPEVDSVCQYLERQIE